MTALGSHEQMHLFAAEPRLADDLIRRPHGPESGAARLLKALIIRGLSEASVRPAALLVIELERMALADATAKNRGLIAGRTNQPRLGER